MKPAAFKKLTATQSSRLSEITLLSTRIREKSRDTLNANIVRARLDAIKEIWSEARKVHSEIVAQTGAATDRYTTDGIFASLQTSYEDTLDYLLTLSFEFEKDGDHTPRATALESTSSMTRPAKLPKLDLPTFSGRYEDWESFCDLFTVLVHNAPSVDQVTKLQYLKSCLTGAAADLVKDVSITCANYESTWRALKGRFYNPWLTVANHLNALLNLPYLKRESAPKIRVFADEFQRIVRALKNLQMPVESWEIWLVHVLGARLDLESRKLWESELSVKDQAYLNLPPDRVQSEQLNRFPTFAELAAFLEKRAHALSMIGVDSKVDRRMVPSNKPISGSRKIFNTGAVRPVKGSASRCPLCPALHALMRCPVFTAKDTYERRGEVRRLRLCFNCLGRHNCRDCTSNGRCGKCRDKHHTLLHFENKIHPQAIQPSMGRSPRGEQLTEAKPAGMNVLTVCSPAPKSPVILATAQIIIIGPNGTRTRARALLDQGSEGSFITESIVQLLELNRERVKIPLSVVGGNTAMTAHSKVTFTICSRSESEYKFETEALVLPRLTSKLPVRNILDIDLRQFLNMDLADPQFSVPGSIDIILGADIYGQLLRSGLRRFPPSHLIAQHTAFGWIISGPTLNNPRRRAEQKPGGCFRALYSVKSDDDLHNSLDRFWALEELPRVNLTLKPDDEFCERQFVNTHARATDGRFIIHLPVKGNLPEVGAETKRMALGSLKTIHRRFENDPALGIVYKDFMTTYEALGHMTRVPHDELDNPRA